MGNSNGECCMCGDYGLPSHLFKCKHCGFRSQHEYCSDLYPEAESYHSCNWCLALKEDAKRGEVSDCHKDEYVVAKKISKDQTKIIKVGEARSNRPGQLKSKNTKRVIRRTRSEEISNGGSIVKQVFRNKVRRYKLLDEVSC